jgi:hypothetical protein
MVLKLKRELDVEVDWGEEATMASRMRIGGKTHRWLRGEMVVIRMPNGLNMA